MPELCLFKAAPISLSQVLQDHTPAAIHLARHELLDQSGQTLVLQWEMGKNLKATNTFEQKI